MFGVSDIFIILLGFGAFELGFYLGMKTERENKNEQKKIVNKNSFSGTIPKEFRNKNDIKKDVVNFSMAITDTVKTNLLENTLEFFTI